MARFEPGKSGNPAGRRAGTPNKKTLAWDACDEYNCNPFEIMAKIAMGVLKDTSGRTLKIHAHLRLEAAAELAQYLAPKLKAMEISTEDGKGVSFYFNSPPPSEAKDAI